MINELLLTLLAACTTRAQYPKVWRDYTCHAYTIIALKAMNLAYATAKLLLSGRKVQFFDHNSTLLTHTKLITSRECNRNVTG